MIVIAQQAAALEKLQLTTLAQVRAFRGGAAGSRRDVVRIEADAAAGRPQVLFLKRNWQAYKKDGLASLLRRGAVWSIARREWENSRALQQAGIRVAAPVAYGEDCSPLWENFSFIITEAASGDQPLDQFIRDCHDPARRRQVFDALAEFTRRLHAAGLATPDFYTRHIFVDTTQARPEFCLIDMARLDRQKPLSPKLRARDLAALNVTAPRQLVSARERLRFLKIYAGQQDRQLIRLIQRRMEKLLTHRRFQRVWSAPRDQ